MPRWIPLTLIALVGLALVGATAVAAAPPTQAGPDPAGIKVKLEPFVQGLENPVMLTSPADDSGRMFVVEKAGRIRIIKNGALTGQPFLDITDRVLSTENERGLLGLAFHPNYKQNGLFVVAYTAKSPAGQITYCTFKVSASNPDRAEAQSEKLILSWPHNRSNHNGGNVVFGPDGYLYLGTGDGGGGGDPDRNGQKVNVFLAKMLRIDIDHGDPYSVPPDNPFVGNADFKPEIWAYGLRNPWRYSFDRETGDLYIGDVGQNQWEEVDFQPRASKGGENYGWNIMEGSHCYNATDCDKSGKVLPVAEYSHSDGCSITGGYVYRGSQFPGLVGLYVYADYCNNTIWGLSRDGSGAWRSAVIGTQAGLGIQSFGEGPDGEIYVVGGNGKIMRLTQSGGGDDTPTPTMTATGPQPTATTTASATAPPSVTPTSTTALPPGTPTTAVPPGTPTPTPSGRRVDVKGSEYKFEPNVLTAQEGEDLNIVLENIGQRPHDIVFELDGGRVEKSQRATAGQTTSVDFLAPTTAGRYEYYCSVGNHRAQGMVGTLVVGNPPPVCTHCKAYLRKGDRCSPTRWAGKARPASGPCWRPGAGRFPAASACLPGAQPVPPVPFT